MKQLSTNESKSVEGGFLPVLAAVVAVVVFPKVINDHRKEYNQWGRNLGEALYEHNHPYDPNK